MRRRGGFTLIELLVVLTVLAVLFSLVVPVVGSVLRRGAQTREMAAGRSLGQAYLLYATENRGRVMAGYDGSEGAFDGEGREIPHPVNARYPWRLAPYLNYEVDGVFQLDRTLARREGESWESYVYRVSVYPALGMNIFYVGGDMSGESGQGLKPVPAHEAMFGRFAVTRISDAVSPADLIVFASARHAMEGKARPGFFKVEAPRVTSDRWQGGEWREGAAPNHHGFVDLRWGGKAVTARLDGSVRMMGEAELRDMRHWANPAAEAGDPEWRLTRVR